MGHVLLTTIYSIDSIILLITKFSINKLYLIRDKNPDSTLKEMIKKLKGMFGKVIEIIEYPVEVYDIVKITGDIVKLIDSIKQGEEIYANITPSRKTQALGLLLAVYKRNSRIKRIVYVVEETNEIVDLPLLSFDVSESQLKILERIEDSKSFVKLAKDIGISRAMLYRNIKSLIAKGMIEKSDGKFKLTDAGRIGRM